MPSDKIPSIFEVRHVTAVFGEAVLVEVSGEIVVVNAAVAEQFALQLIVAANLAREHAVEPFTPALPLEDAFALEGVSA
jgi:hypothetical protein